MLPQAKVCGAAASATELGRNEGSAFVATTTDEDKLSGRSD
jgi:hypothetical protein